MIKLKNNEQLEIMKIAGRITGEALYLAGEAVKEGVTTLQIDKIVRTHIEKCVFDEIIPTLDLPKDELIAYAKSVIERFSNPYIKHYLSSIALNSLSKFKVRVLPSILEYVKRFNKNPETLVFAFAKLLDFYKTDMTNDDPAATEFVRTHTTREILENAELWGEDVSFLTDAVEKYRA